MQIFIGFEQVWTIWNNLRQVLSTIRNNWLKTRFSSQTKLGHFYFSSFSNFEAWNQLCMVLQILHRFWTSLDKFGQVLVKTRKLHWTKMAMFFLKVSLDSLAFLLPRSLKRVIRHGSTSEVNANFTSILNKFRQVWTSFGQNP